MPTAKARYVGDGAGDCIPDFSEKLKATLRSYYPNPGAEADPTFGHPADAFVLHLLDEAWWAKSELHSHALDCTKQELRAEKADLLKVLLEAQEKLSTLSRDFDRLLGVEADPLGCADKIHALVRHVEQVTFPEQLQMALRPREKQHAVAVEMAIRVLRVLDEYGIKPAATCDPDLGRASVSVKVLKHIGDDMGLVLAETSWRDLIMEAKQKADLDQ